MTATAKLVASVVSRDEILELFALPFNELLFQAHTVLKDNWPDGTVHLSSLLSVKTGGCSEDCGYCAQSAKNDTGLEASKMLSREDVRAAAQKAKNAGAKRFCMSAAWRKLKDRDIEQVAELVTDVKALGMETCLTLGMLTGEQATHLREAGLDYYNHNVDTSPEYYDKVVSTRSYSDRIDTLKNVRNAGMKVCSGGIVGMGEERSDRAGMLETLVNLAPPPESVPINMLVPIAGTPLENVAPIDPLELVRTIAVARIIMPNSYVRLSAGRQNMSDETQALCFFAGANAVFYGEKLLTTDNQDQQDDMALFARLGLNTETGHTHG